MVVSLSSSAELPKFTKGVQYMELSRLTIQVLQEKNLLLMELYPG